MGQRNTENVKCCVTITKHVCTKYKLKNNTGKRMKILKLYMRIPILPAYHCSNYRGKCGSNQLNSRCHDTQSLFHTLSGSDTIYYILLNPWILPACALVAISDSFLFFHLGYNTCKKAIQLFSGNFPYLVHRTTSHINNIIPIFRRLFPFLRNHF